jgi:hypothetical protein
VVAILFQRNRQAVSGFLTVLEDHAVRFSNLHEPTCDAHSDHPDHQHRQ